MGFGRVRLFAIVVLALGLSGAASANVIVGVNDEAALDPTLTGWFYPTMGQTGLSSSAITIRWDEADPTGIPDQANVARAITLAAANGQTVVLDLFPLHSQVFTLATRCPTSTDPQSCGDAARLQAFAAWAGQVAAAFPTVRQFIVMNECNQPLFVNPQWDATGANQAGQICGRALVGAYDRIKAVNPQNVVWGVGLSPRGNDNPAAVSNSSSSPVLFLKALGAWFKAYAQATGRTKPLMDGLDFHPYPIPQSQPFAQGYSTATSASVSNLPRIYQAFYDGFNGSPQPTVGQQAGGGLPVSLNEVGIQTDVTGKTGYVGAETAANSAGGVLGEFATEAYQSTWYRQMLDLVACDPNVRLVNIYHLLDEPSLAGWQSGLYYVDRTAKLAATTVHDWIATTAGRCQGAVKPWTPPGLSAVSSPSPVLPSANGPRIVVASAGRIRIFGAADHVLRRVLAPFGTGYTGPMTVAVGRVNRDAVADIAVGTGSGVSSAVKVLNGKSGATIASYVPFPASFKGGVTVAIGDVDHDGLGDLVVGSGAGTPTQVKVFSGTNRRLVSTLSPFGAAYSGGATVAAGDVNGDGKADIVVGSGPGSPSQVVLLSGSGLSPATAVSLGRLVPFRAAMTGGVTVAAGDLDGDGKADVVVGTGPGAPTQVKIHRDGGRSRVTGPLGLFSPFATAFAGGVSVSVADVNGDGRPDLVVAPGEGGGSQVKVFDGKTGALLGAFLGSTGSTGLAVATG